MSLSNTEVFSLYLTICYFSYFPFCLFYWGQTGTVVSVADYGPRVPGSRPGSLWPGSLCHIYPQLSTG